MTNAEEPCSPVDFLCQGGNAIGDAIGGIANDAITQAALRFAEDFDRAVQVVMTSWLAIRPDLDLINPDVGAQAWIATSFNAITLFLVVIGLMIAGTRMALTAKGEPLGQVIKQFGTLILITSVGALIVGFGITAGHVYGEWVLGGTDVGLSAGTGLLAGLAAQVPGIVIIIGIIGVTSVLIQYAIMLLRAALLPLLVAFWPIVAAFGMIPGKEGAASKIANWLLAFVIYVPIAASIYAFAWQLASGDGQDLDSQISGALNGVVLIILAVLVLPALLRLLAPAANAIGTKTGGMMAMAGGAAVITAGVAAGAAVATSGASLGATGAAAGGGAAASGGGAATGGAVSGGVSSGAASSGAASGGAEAATTGSAGSAAADGASGNAGSDGATGSSGSSGSSAQGAEPTGGGGSNAATGAGAAAQSLSESAENSNAAEGMIDE